MTQDIEQIVRRMLTGCACSDVTARGNYLEIRFGNCLLIVYAAWRITEGGVVHVGSGAGEQQLDRVVSLLTGQLIGAVQIIGIFHDLQLTFTSGYRFETFVDEGAFEQWNLMRTEVPGSPQQMVIAGLGNQISVL